METALSTFDEMDDVYSGIEGSRIAPMNEDGGYFDAIVRASLKLISQEDNSEIQWHGLKLILHLLRFRWKEIDSIGFGDRMSILGLLEKGAGHATKLASKRSAAAFVAEIVWSHGVCLLESLVPYLVSLSAEGACEAELVCLILRSILSVGITSSTHFKAGKDEIYSHGLNEFLPQILPLLCCLLHKHTQAALAEQSNQRMEEANQHECTVIAVLDAALDYMKWTPLYDLSNLDIFWRCGSLLCSKKFSNHALQFLTSVWELKRYVEYDAAVRLMFSILFTVLQNQLKLIEQEDHHYTALWASFRCHTDKPAKAVENFFDIWASVLETCQDPSKPHSDIPPTCSAPMPQVLDEVSPPFVLEDNTEEMDYLIDGRIILSEAFIFVASCPWIENNAELLRCILLPVSTIWDQLDVYHFCDHRFRTSVYNVIVFCEEVLKNYQGQSNCSNLKVLAPPLLSLLLKMLQCVHSLWMEEFEEVVESYCIMKGIADEDILLKSVREVLLEICRIGYKVIGICACLDASFDELLDSTIICDILMKDIDSMDFQHVTWLIEYAIIPLVQKCPSKLWTKWIYSLLQPLCHYCDYTLHGYWCNVLYGSSCSVLPNKMHVSKNLADTSSEEGKKLRIDLFKLTCELSNFLATVALPKLNDGMTNESSLIRYLLYHDGLNDSIRRLIRNIFGYWTDDEAKINAAPLCQSLICLASDTKSNNFVSCIKDDIIPCIIRCLALQACHKSSSNRIFKSKSDNNNKSSSNMDHVVTNLCESAYNCIQNQGLSGEDRGDESGAETFEIWLGKQITVTQYQNSSLDELEEFVWIWEIEAEFRDYLPKYVDMIYEVNKFGDGVKDDIFRCEFSSSLMDEFMANIDIDSFVDSVQWAASSMLPRKISSVHWKRQNEQMFKFYCKLINFKPYIKWTGYDENMRARIFLRKDIQELIENTSVEWSCFPSFLKRSAVEFVCRILEYLEPQFHPLIREGHKDVLTETAKQFAFGEYICHLQPFQAFSTDFLGHLQRYAQNYIDEKNKKAGYYTAREQAELHEKFDTCLASGEFDHYIRQHDFPRSILEDYCFLNLNSDLLKLSLERRTKLLYEQDQLSLYYRQMKNLVTNEQLRDTVQILITELEAEGFFNVDDDSVEWGNKRFSDLVEEVQHYVFPSLNRPKYYVIRGILDFWQIVHMEDASLEDSFAVVVGGAWNRWMEYRHLFWRDARYYKHAYYDTIQDPIKKIWKKQEN